MTKTILCLDLGVSSIDWAVVKEDSENSTNKKNASGRKIPEKGIKKEIYERHVDVMKTLPLTLQQYIELMSEKGLNLTPTINKQNQIQGFRVSNKD